MKKRLVKIVCSLVAAVCFLPLFSAFAISYAGAPEIDTASGILYNLETEETVYSKNANDRLSPAAFTKLMTAYLAFEYKGKNGNENVTVTEEMLSSAGGASMGLRPGEILPLDSLLAGLVVQNANDAALVLASAIGGNISSFVEMMNDRAKEMGMEDTYYSNPTGVDSATMYTCLSDTLLLCRALYRVNDFMLLSETPKATIPATNLVGERVYTNKNALVPYSYVTDYYMKNVRGMIAGYTPQAGYCVATVRGKNLVILSGGKDRSERGNGTDISSYRDAKTLLEWVENDFAVREVVSKGQVIAERRVRLASGVDHMILVAGESLKKLLPAEADLSQEITLQVRTQREVFTAPVIKGSSYGEMDVIYQGEVIGTVPLHAQSNIGLSRWLVAWDAVVSFFSHGPAKVILILVICAAVCYVLYLFLMLWVQYLRRNRERNRAIAELMEMENRRMRKVRLEERKANQARMRKVRSAFRAGFQVLQGDAELEKTGRRKKAPASRAVAKVPEKYRSVNRASQTGRIPPDAKGKGGALSGKSQKAGEVYRTGRPHRPASPRKAPPSHKAPPPPSQNRRGKK